MKRNGLKMAALLAIMFLSTSIAMANTNTAIVSGNWETASNWSLGTVPVAADDVVIPAGKAMTITVAGDYCASLTIAATGSLTINSNKSLFIGGSLSNAGTFTTNSGSTVQFYGGSNSSITGGGTYTIVGTISLNMFTAATTLDVQDANFIAGINAGGKYYFNFQQGTWKMDNAATLNDCYNSGSANALTIPYGVVIETDNGTMYLCKNAPTNKAILSGKLNLVAGNIFVQTNQAGGPGQDFRYKVNGGTPQVYISGGNLSIGAGFNALSATDYIDFHMTGGFLFLAYSSYSNWITFQLADVVGGKTFMSGGLIIVQDACNAAIEDVDMGGANVAATQYSVTGGTLQLGYLYTLASSTYFGINAEPATNYPNIVFQGGSAKNVSAWVGGTINMLSLYVNTNMTFDATGFPIVNIMSNNGTYAFDDEGGFVQSTNTVKFSGSVPQYITSTALASITFYNLNIANTSGNVILQKPIVVSNKLSFTSGKLDASQNSVTISTGSNAITGVSNSSYVITGNGIAGTTGSLNINNIPANTNTLFPLGNSTYYLPATINPGANAGNSYSTFVFTGATTNAQANGPSFSAPALAQILNAVWSINRTAGAGTASLSLNWSSSGAALEGSVFKLDGPLIGVSQYTAGAWQIATGGGSIASATATSSFSSFTQFGVGGMNQVLPIVLSDFTAVLKNNNTVLLSWNVSDNSNISDFAVQRSIDGSDWSTIGTVAGDNTAAENHFTFIDENPSRGANYYRLTIQNTDGTYTYSPVRSIMLSSIKGINVFPNPTTNVINVSFGNTGSELAVRLINQAGQILQSVGSGNTNGSVISMNVHNYASGVYIIQVVGENKVLQTSSVLIVH